MHIWLEDRNVTVYNIDSYPIDIFEKVIEKSENQLAKLSN